MPQAIAAIADWAATALAESIGTALVPVVGAPAAAATATAIYAVTDFAVSTAITVGLFAASNALLEPRMPKAAEGQLPVRQQMPSRRRVLNRYRMSGAYMLHEAAANLYVVIAVCQAGPAPLDSFGGYWLNDDAVTLDANSRVIPPGPEAARYKGGYVWLYNRLGAFPEVPYNDHVQTWANEHEGLDALGTGVWPDTARGDGIASLFMVCGTVSQGSFRNALPNGEPLPSALPIAVVYDWRDEAQAVDDPSTWRPSWNPVLWLAAYETGALSDDAERLCNFNCRILPNIDNWTEAANDCEDQIPLANAGAVLTQRTRGRLAPPASNVFWFSNVAGLAVGATVHVGVPAGSTILGPPAEDLVVRSIGSQTPQGYEVQMTTQAVYDHLINTAVSWAIPDGVTVTEDRYRLVGWFYDDNHPADVRRKILEACDGFTVEGGDRSLRVQVGKYRDPLFTLPGNQVLGYSWKRGVPIEQATNQYDISFVSPDYNWTVIPGVPWRDADDVEARGAIMSEALELDWVPSHGQARRLAKRKMFRTLADGRGTIKASLYGLNALYSQSNTRPRYMRVQIPGAFTALNDRVVEILAARISLKTLSVELDVIAIDSSIDDWDAATEESSANSSSKGSGASVTISTSSASGGGSVTGSSTFGGTAGGSDWDGGVVVATSSTTTGATQASVLQIAAGEVVTEGDITTAVTPGQTLYVFGTVGIPASGGATSINVGIESQDAARDNDNVTTYSVSPMPAAGTFAAFSGTVVVPSGDVWARPYITAAGGTAWIEEVHVTAAGPSSAADVSGLSSPVIASENLTAGEFVNIWSDSGVAKARKADATDDSKPADGFVLAAVASGATAAVFGPGVVNSGLSGMTPGKMQYLAAGGGRTETDPTSTGNYQQALGKAVSATALMFAPQATGMGA